MNFHPVKFCCSLDLSKVSPRGILKNASNNRMEKSRALTAKADLPSAQLFFCSRVWGFLLYFFRLCLVTNVTDWNQNFAGGRKFSKPTNDIRVINFQCFIWLLSMSHFNDKIQANSSTNSSCVLHYLLKIAALPAFFLVFISDSFGCDVTCQACRENSPRYSSPFQASSALSNNTTPLGDNFSRRQLLLCYWRQSGQFGK